MCVLNEYTTRTLEYYYHKISLYVPGRRTDRYDVCISRIQRYNPRLT